MEKLKKIKEISEHFDLEKDGKLVKMIYNDSVEPLNTFIESLDIINDKEKKLTVIAIIEKWKRELATLLHGFEVVYED